MRGCASAALSALPVFLLGCVAVLIYYQILLGYHQAASTVDGWGPRTDSIVQLQTSSTPPEHTAQQQLPVQHTQLGGQQTQQGPQQLQAQQQQERDTLVVYIFNEDDPVFTENFHYFLLAGVQEESRCAYVILVQLKAFRTAEELPSIPGVTYLYYGGTCYEWGMLGWLFNSGQVQWQPYKYFIFLSSAVRGPFLPVYLTGKMHWTQPFISRLTNKVKLVGPVISCSATPSQLGNASAPWAHNPHIPLHAVATDRVGVEVLQQAGVFDCHTDIWQEKYLSEHGAVAAMFTAGYSIDCLLVRYQGVDWRDRSAWGCNRGWDPTGPGDFAYDGISLDPVEVIFSRVNTPMLQQRVPSVLKAVKYSDWALSVVAEAAGVPTDHHARVSGNDFRANKGLYKLPRILTAVVRGINCFDVDFFIRHNQDLFDYRDPSKVDQQLAWKFFVYIAQFEDRPFRFTCDMNYTSVAVPAF